MTEFLDKVKEATKLMRALFPETPLQREDLSPVRSYKRRGAFNNMRHALSVDSSANKFVCASAGNHAQGVAFVCRHFNVKGYIFMPVTTPKQKIDKTKVFTKRDK